MESNDKSANGNPVSDESDVVDAQPTTEKNDVANGQPAAEKPEKDTDPGTIDWIATQASGSDDGAADPSMLCGWFSIRPNWLQWFNTPLWLALTISLLMFVQGMVVSGFAYTSLTSIETRFQLPSVATGLILSVYDLTQLILLPFVSYFGATRNKPRVLAIGAVILGLGFFMWTLPHFTTGYYAAGEVADGYEPMCRLDGNYTYYENCDEYWTSLSYYFILFAAAQVVVAIGASPIYNIGLAFVDENVTTKDSGWYVGVTHAFAVLGPVTGFILGAVFLSIYTDIANWENVDLTPEDPAWVGAWWLGFLIAWVLAWLVAIPVGSYPPILPTREKIEEERKTTAHQNKDSDLMKTKAEFGKSWKDLGPSTKYLLCNPAYMHVTLAQCAQNLLLSGVAPFMPKFLENQFALTSTQGAMIVGVTALPGAVGGTVLGGWIIQRFDLGVKSTIRFCIVIALLTMAMLPIFLMHCPLERIAGVTEPYDPISTGLEEVNLSHPCNADCHCAEALQYTPLCGTTDLVYFDACYAGCKSTPDQENYYNCSCIFTNSSMSEPEAVAGKCPVDCWQLIVFVILLFFMMLLGFTILTPYKYLTLRAVVDGQRSYALGVSSIFNKLFGSVPGPIIFGLIIDSSCIVWQVTCDSRGTCWIYDNFQFGMKFFVTGEIFMGITTFFFVMAYIFYKPPPEKDGDADPTSSEMDEMPPITSKTMSQDQLDAIVHRGRSEVSLLGYTKKDPDEVNVII